MKRLGPAGSVSAAGSGTAALPGIAFALDPNTGIYSPGADQLAISTGGTARLTSSTTALTSALPIDVPLGAAATPSLTFTGDLNTGIYSPAADTIAFAEGGSEVARLDSSGRLLLGTSSGRSVYGSNARLQVEGTDYPTSALNLIANSNTNSGTAPYLQFARSRGTTVGSSTIVQSGDRVGGVAWLGANGSNLDVPAALIEGWIDTGTPSATSMPGRLTFSVTADGVASPTEAMRIKSTGIINFSNAPTHADNTAATAAGLAVGDVYKTVLGVLMIRF